MTPFDVVMTTLSTIVGIVVVLFFFAWLISLGDESYNR